MHNPPLHPALAQYFDRIRSGRWLVYVLLGIAAAIFLGGVGFVVSQSRFEAWTLAALLPAALPAALARRVHRRVSDPLGTPEAVAILRGTLVGFYVRATTMRAAGVQTGVIHGIVLDLPGGKEAYLNPRGPEDRAALLNALALQCPHARRTPSR